MELYEKIEDIGKGSFGKVTKIRRKIDGRIMVWKELNYGKMNEKEKQQIVAEVNILRELKHPNIVRYYDRSIDKQQLKIYIIMEYCQGGDLQKVIRQCLKKGEHLSEEFIWRIFSQIVSGLHMCHRRTDQTFINRGDQPHNQNSSAAEQEPTGISGSQKIMHRDLKPGNIFLSGNQEAKIGDFGLARVMNNESVFACTHVGTPYYMSPEQINEQNYNDKSDIWSLGCIIYEMAALHPPFKAANHLALAMKIKEGKFARIPERYSDELWRVIRCMLQQSPKNRPDIVELSKVQQIEQILQPEANPVKSTPSSTCQCDQSQVHAQMKQHLSIKEEQLVKREQQLQNQSIDLVQRTKNLEKAHNAIEMQKSSVQQLQKDLQQKEKLLFQILDQYNLSHDTNDLAKTLQMAVLYSSKQNKEEVNKNVSQSHQNAPTSALGIHSRQNSAGRNSVTQLLNNNRSDPELMVQKAQHQNNSKPSHPTLKKGQSSTNSQVLFCNSSAVGSSQSTNYAEKCSTGAYQVNKQSGCATSTKKIGDAGSPMEYLKKFKMQKKIHSQKLKESSGGETSNTVFDENKSDTLAGSATEYQDHTEVSEGISEAAALQSAARSSLCRNHSPDDLSTDNCFRQTTFNPKENSATIGSKQKKQKLIAQKQQVAPSTASGLTGVAGGNNTLNYLQMLQKLKNVDQPVVQPTQQPNMQFFNKTFDSRKNQALYEEQQQIEQSSPPVQVQLALKRQQSEPAECINPESKLPPKNLSKMCLNQKSTKIIGTAPPKVPGSARAQTNNFFTFDKTKSTSAQRNALMPKQQPKKQVLQRVESAQVSLNKLMQQAQTEPGSVLQTANRSRSGSLHMSKGDKMKSSENIQDRSSFGFSPAYMTMTTDKIDSARENTNPNSYHQAPKPQQTSNKATLNRQNSSGSSSSTANLAMFKKKILQQVKQQQVAQTTARCSSNGARPPLTDRGSSSGVNAKALPENLALLRQHVPSLNQAAKQK